MLGYFGLADQLKLILTFNSDLLMIFSTSDVSDQGWAEISLEIAWTSTWFWCFAYSCVQASNHRQESPRAGGLPSKLSTYKRSLSFGPDAAAMKTYDSETALCSATASCSDVRIFHAVCLHCFPIPKKSVSPLFCILYPWSLLPDLTSLWRDIFRFCALTLLVVRQEWHPACRKPVLVCVGGDDLTGTLHVL